MQITKIKVTVATDEYCDFSISLWLHYIVPFEF